MFWKDKKCSDLECENCPLYGLHCIGLYNHNNDDFNNLKKILQQINKKYHLPENVYNAYEKELDEEVKK